MSERTRFLTSDLPQVLATRAHPALTVWNRLEVRPRTSNFDRALQAEVRDALWMLTRQWQMGEFKGSDAGSPIAAKIRVTTSRLSRYRPGETGAEQEFDETIPLETKVERRPVPWTLDLQLLMGRQWLKMMPFPDLRKEFIKAYPIHQPDPAALEDFPICSRPNVWSGFAATAGRCMNGAQLYQHLAEGGHAWDGLQGVAGREGDLDKVSARFRRWFERLIARPEADDAWIPSRLEYRFRCSAPAREGAKTLAAEEYYQGHLDWYGVDFDPETSEGTGSPVEGNPAIVTRVVLPTPVAFDGMPNTRWWAFEDAKTNFGDVKPDTTDLAKLMLIEFGLVFVNDWFVVPFVLPAGSFAHVDGIVVKDVFGERTWIDPAGSGLDDDWQRWAMFLTSVRGKGTQLADTSLTLLPVASRVEESKPLEEVMLVRDEVANMVWAIETAVPLATGEAERGVEAARALRAYFESDVVARLGPVPTSPPTAPTAAVRYELMNGVPENWIPFIPVHRENETRSIQLQRAAMLRILPGDDRRPFRKVEPRTALMREGLARRETYFIHEEEVPRAGIVVRQSYQRTRWRDGRAWVWIGARKQTGRGEGHSGLAFDRAIEVPPPKT